jgi:hypothetical protein
MYHCCGVSEIGTVSLRAADYFLSVIIFMLNVLLRKNCGFALSSVYPSVCEGPACLGCNVKGTYGDRQGLRSYALTLIPVLSLPCLRAQHLDHS